MNEPEGFGEVIRFCVGKFGDLRQPDLDAGPGGPVRAPEPVESPAATFLE